MILRVLWLCKFAVFVSVGLQADIPTARGVALDFLMRQDSAMTYTTNVEEYPSFRQLQDQRERALARMLTSTCLRRLGEIDAELSRFYSDDVLLWWRRRHSPGKMCAKRRATIWVLRLGVAQLRYCDGIVDRAAVHESVKLAKRVGARVGVCNAVLRRTAAATPLPEALELNVTPWFARLVKRDYGAATLERYMRATMREPTFDVTCLEQVSEFRQLECGSWRAPPGRTFPLHARCWAQDAAASAAAAVVPASKGDKLSILDACAAPGGKTMQLAASGHNVLAVDVSAARLERLRENLNRLDLKARVLHADVCELSPEVLFDVVVLDAPCTCTGTARRHPDVLRKHGLSQLLTTQRNLLEACWTLTKPNGCLVYSTCSLLKDENERQIDAFIESHSDALVWPIEFLPGFHPDAISERGYLRILPWHLICSDISTESSSGVSRTSSEASSTEDCFCDSHFVARLHRADS